MRGKFNWYVFPYPVLALGFYLAFGFLLNIWHPTWLIFLTIPVFYTIVAMTNAKNFRTKANIFPYPVLCLILYLALGFDYSLWHPAWLLFLTVPVYYMIVNAVKQ
ncbi:MAG: hypothetical protein FWH10_05995 [Oscillospiraceae bacterium]|nr:hypothetical protein [Oscillospiraceae bacterium]